MNTLCMLQNRFKKILVALDGSIPSRKGLNESISLARQSEATITAIHILPGFPRTMGLSKDAENRIMSHVRKFMSDARISTARHGIEFDEKIVKSNDIVAAI